MWKRNLGKDFYSSLCSTETPFAFKFTMSCFDINLFIKSVIYFTAQGWIIWQNKTHRVSQISISLGIVKVLDTAPGLCCALQPAVPLSRQDTQPWQRAQASINICTFPLLPAGICKWDISQNALERSHHDQATFCLFCWFFLPIPAAINQPHISLVFLSCHWQFPRDWSLPPLLFDERPLC